MKKFYLFSLTLFSFTAFGQTIVQSDLPFAGLAWTSGVDTTYNDPVPAGGAAQNWNYASLQYDYVDTSGFGNASGTPYASIYPTANLAAHKLSTGEWTYFTSASSGFYVNGFVTDTAAYVLDPPQMYVPVPFSYGDSHTDISRIVIDTTFLTFNAQAILNFHADFQADGYGSLTTPVATYPSTLRVKETLLETDSLMVDYLGTGTYTLLGSQQRQLTYYRWFQHAGTANFILGIDADSLGTTAMRSDYVLQWAVLGVHELTAGSGLQSYPDPAANGLTISGAPGPITSIDIFNALGANVYSHREENIAGIQSRSSHEVQLDVSNWTPGFYFYSLVSGNRQFRGRFSVMH